MGVGRVGQGRSWLLWIFIRDIDKAEESLMVLFFVLVFSVVPSLLKNFLPAPLDTANNLDYS